MGAVNLNDAPSLGHHTGKGKASLQQRGFLIGLFSINV